MVCKWYEVCPIKMFTDEGKLEKIWVEKYCKREDGYKECVRYRMEEEGKFHPDYMLPNGELRKGLMEDNAGGRI